MPDLRRLLWILPIVVVAVALYASVRDVGFLSDDYLMLRYWDQAAAAVRWDRVAQDFTGPWFGSVRDMYRPVVTLAYALQLAVSADPRWFHLGNVLMVLVAALAVGGFVWLRFPSSPWLATLAGGIVLLHPAAVEPSHWVASRTTALEVMFSCLAMSLYAGFLYGRLRSRWPAFVAMGLALASKEGALALAASLTVVDMLSTRASARARYMGVRPFWVLLVAYLLFRKVTLGVFTSAREDLSAAGLLQGYLVHGSWLLGPPGAWQTVVASVLLVACAVFLLRRQPARGVLFLAWMALLLVPTSVVPLQGTAWDGRLVYHVVPALALFCVEAAVLLRAPLRLVAALLLLTLWGWSALPAARAYREGGKAVDSFQQALLQAHTTSGTAAPVGALAFSRTQDHHVQLLQRQAWGLLVARPFVPADVPMVSLESVLPDFGTMPSRVDATPAVAVLAAGGALVSWSDHRAVTIRAPVPFSGGPLGQVPGKSGAFAAQPSWQPFAATVVAVELPAPATACSIRFVEPIPGQAFPGLAEAGRTFTTDEPSQRFYFDVASANVALVLQNFGLPWPALEVEVEGVGAPQGTVVRLMSADDQPLAEPLRGRALSLEQVPMVLRPPQPGARLYLMTPLTTVGDARNEDGTLSSAARHELGFLQTLLPGARVFYCWRLGGDAGTERPARSSLDWFCLR